MKNFLKKNGFLSDKYGIQRERLIFTMNNIKMNSVNVNTNVSNAKKTQESKQKEEAKPQLKEHCSSKAGQALKNAALGVMLAASVIAGAKAATVPAKAAENQQPIDNSTSISQQAETNAAPKTEIEAAVDEMMENKEVQTTKLHVGDRNNCHGKMTSPLSFLGGKNYECAEITEDGSLVFYNKVLTAGNVIKFEPVNSFDLKAQPDGKSIELQTGSRFEESTNVHGDYIELADDGRTFNVYNSDGENIGHVKADTPESNVAKFIIGGLGTAAILGAPVVKYLKEY